MPASFTYEADDLIWFFAVGYRLPGSNHPGQAQADIDNTHIEVRCPCCAKGDQGFRPDGELCGNCRGTGFVRRPRVRTPEVQRKASESFADMFRRTGSLYSGAWERAELAALSRALKVGKFAPPKPEEDDIDVRPTGAPGSNYDNHRPGEIDRANRIASRLQRLHRDDVLTLSRAFGAHGRVPLRGSIARARQALAGAATDYGRSILDHAGEVPDLEPHAQLDLLASGVSDHPDPEICAWRVRLAGERRHLQANAREAIELGTLRLARAIRAWEATGAALDMGEPFMMLRDCVRAIGLPTKKIRKDLKDAGVLRRIGKASVVSRHDLLELLPELRGRLLVSSGTERQALPEHLFAPLCQRIRELGIVEVTRNSAVNRRTLTRASEGEAVNPATREKITEYLATPVQENAKASETVTARPYTYRGTRIAPRPRSGVWRLPTGPNNTPIHLQRRAAAGPQLIRTRSAS